MVRASECVCVWVCLFVVVVYVDVCVGVCVCKYISSSCVKDLNVIRIWVFTIRTSGVMTWM